MLKRAAILDERADTKLCLNDKAVFHYREDRLNYWYSKGQDVDQVTFNEQYDAMQFSEVQDAWKGKTTRKTMAMALLGKSVVRFSQENSPPHLSLGIHQEWQSLQNLSHFSPDS